MKKLISIVGTRPQFIKLAPMFYFKNHNFIHKIIHTGQHYDFNMDKIFFQELNLPDPDYHLGVGSGTNLYQFSEISKKLEEVLLKENPDCVIVYGDTNSTLAGAISASKLGFKLAHIEAGLRSYNKRMQEEINRIVTDHLSDLLFCPTINSKKNLKKEGINNAVFLVGDLMIELLKRVENSVKERQEDINKKYGSFILLTLHRAENVDNLKILKNIMDSVSFVSKKYYTVIFPVHPRTMKQLKLIEFDKGNILLTNPVSYFDMLCLENSSRLIITDSGGIQKEALFFGVPCITVRNETEWVETIESKTNYLVSPLDPNFSSNLLKTVDKIIDNRIPNSLEIIRKYFKFFDSSKRIYNVLEDMLWVW